MRSRTPKIQTGGGKAEEEYNTPTEFFKYLFFDQYLRNTAGSNRYEVAHTFYKYLYNAAQENVKYGILTGTLSQELFFKEFDSADDSIYNLIINSFDLFYDILNKKKGFILLSGWTSEPEYGGGHAIILYFEKIESVVSASYNVYIVNSGAGIHYHGDPVNDSSPIIIQFTNVSVEQVKSIYYVHNFLVPVVASLRNGKLHNLNMYIEYYGLEKIYGIKSLSEIKLRKTNPVSLAEQIKKLKQDKSAIDSVGTKINFDLGDPFWDLIAEYYFEAFAESKEKGQATIAEDLFYKSILQILKQNTRNVILYDEEQLSSSCTFFSTYYFIKHFIFKSNPLFQTFIKYIKETEVTEKILELEDTFDRIKNTTPNEFENKWMDKLNIMNMLLKDIDLSQEIKNKIRIILKQKYESFDWTAPTHLELVIIPKPFSSIQLVKDYIDKANSFLIGPSKLIKDLLDVFYAFNTFATLSNSRNYQEDPYVIDWSLMVLTKCCLECYNAIGKTGGEPLIQITREDIQNRKENKDIPQFSIYKLQSDNMKLISNILESINSNYDVAWSKINYNIYDPYDIIRNIAHQCLFNIYQISDDIDIPFIGTTPFKIGDKVYTIDDTFLKKIILVLYSSAIAKSKPYLYGFSFRNIFIELYKKRGLLFSDISRFYPLYRILDTYFYRSSPSMYSNISDHFVQYLELISPNPDPMTPYYATSNNPFYISFSVLISGRQFPDEQGGGINKFTENELYWKKRILGGVSYQSNMKSPLHIIMSAMTDINTVISLINFGDITSLDISEIRYFNILINVCDTLYFTQGEEIYERDDVEDIMTRTPPTNITNLNYIRNYFKIDKRNDLIKTAIENLNTDSFLKNLKFLPNKVYESLLYLLYLYKNEFVIRNKDEFLKYLNEENILFHTLNNNLYKAYKKNLDIVYETNNQKLPDGYQFTKKKKGDAFYKTRDDYLIYNIVLNSSTENIIKAISQSNERTESVNDEYERVYINEEIKYPLYKKRNTQETTELYYYRKSVANRVDNTNGYLQKTFGTEQYYPMKIDGSYMNVLNEHKGFAKVLIKLMKIEEILVWTNSSIFIIELINHEKSHFKYNFDTKEMVFVDESDTEYNVNTNKYEAMLGVWLLGTTNIFLLETKTGIKKLLLLMSKKIINLYKDYYSKATKGNIIDPKTHKEKKENYQWYWAAMNPNLLQDIIEKINDLETIFESTYSIVDIHHTYLSLETNNYDTLISLFISYEYSSNYLALNLLHATIENLNAIEKSKIKIYLGFYDTFTSVLKNNMNNPAWGLYIDNASDDYNNARDKYYKKENPSIDMIKMNYILELDTDINYIQVKKMSKTFADIRKKMEFPDSIRKNTNDPNKIQALKTFLEEFRYSCDPQKPCSVDTIQPAVHPSPHPTGAPPPPSGTIIPAPTYEFDVIFNELLYSSNTKEKSISFLYLTYWSVFYKNLIYLKYKQISNVLQSKKLCDDRDLCGYIIKMLEPLDSELLYSWTSPRRIEDILFELQNGNFIREKQKIILEAIYEEDAVNSIVANEILMGQGKTSTITPMIILHEYYKKIASQEEPPRYFFVVLPSHLVLDSYKIVFTLLNILPNFSTRKETPLIITMDSSREKFLKDTNDKLNIIQIISDTRIKENVLKSIIDDKDDKQYKKNLAKPNFFIFDEVDSLINPLKSDLNIPESTTKSVHEQNDMILSICFTILKNYLYKKTVEPVPNANVNIKHKSTLLYSNMHDPTLAPLIQNKITMTFSQILTMQYNQNFGFGAYINNNKKNHFVAIPYSANLTPVEESEFTDFELFVMLTVYSYLSNKVRKIDIDIVLKYIYKKIHLLDEILQDKMLFPVIIKSFFPEISDILEESYMDVYNLLKINNPYESALLKIQAKINENPENQLAFINFYLSKIVFPKFVKIYKEQNNISMIDIFNPTISNKKVTFSGTVNLNKPGTIIKDELVDIANSRGLWGGQISDIRIDATVEASIEASFYGITVSRTPELILGKEDNPEENLIEYVKSTIDDTTKKYGALIDTAGIILKTEPEEFVRLLYQHMLAKNEAAANKKVFLFVTRDDRRRFIKEGKVFEYNSETFDDLFIYYDHKHCVGTDFKQPFKIHGLVTIKNKNNLTEIAQGIFRLRFVNIGHSIDFYLKETIQSISAESGLNKNKALYKYLEENDAKFLESSNKESKMQCSKYIYRKATNLDSKSYLEKIFFDLILTNDYKNYPEFINYMFSIFQQKLKYKQALIDELKQKNSVSTAVSQNLAVEEQIEVSVEVAVEIQVNTTLSYERSPRIDNLKSIITIDNYYDHTLADAFVEITKIVVDEQKTKWSIFVSMPVFYKIESNLKNLDFNDNKWYYLYNSKKPNSILIITYYEVVVLINNFTASKNPLADTISIIDSYGNYFRDKGKIEFPDVLKLLFMDKTVNVIDKMDPLLKYCKYNGEEKTAIIVKEYDKQNRSKQVDATHIQSLDYLFGFDYTFHGFECKPDSGPTNKETWMDLIGLPSQVKAKEEQELFLKLQEKYNEKHKSLLSSILPANLLAIVAPPAPAPPPLLPQALLPLALLPTTPPAPPGPQPPPAPPALLPPALLPLALLPPGSPGPQAPPSPPAPPAPVPPEPAPPAPAPPAPAPLAPPAPPAPPAPVPPGPQAPQPPAPPAPQPIPAKKPTAKLLNLSKKADNLSKKRQNLTSKIRKNLNMIGAGRYTKRK